MRTISLCSLVLASACNPGDFEQYLDTAPVRVAKEPGAFTGTRYGQAMVTVRGSFEGEPVSRIVASGGGGTPIGFTRAFTNGKVGEVSFLRCTKDIECGGARDIGATMIPFDAWGLETDDPREVCVYMPANATTSLLEGDPRLGGSGYVACEYPVNRPQSFSLGPALADVRGEGSALRFSGFGLPRSHPLGIVVLGVHAKDNRNGAASNGGLYVQPDFVFRAEQNMNIAPFLSLVPLIDPSTGEAFSAAEDAADFGAQVAGAVDGKDFVFAVSQPSKQRVIVASYDDTASGAVTDKFRVHACIEAPDASLRGFGERVQVADLTGDGAPEIIIGTDPVGGAEVGQQGLFVYDGRGLPGPVTGEACPPWDDAPTELPCREQAGLRCEGSGYGASLAVGDIDADGAGDLIIGAPLATVNGKSEVGAMFIVPGSSQGPDVGNAIAITVPSTQGARFGWNVAALHTKDRDEPVASAPGVGELYTVMCTPLESGFGGDALCLD